MEKIYYQLNTNNESFLRVSKELEELGITNNKFFLALYNKDLMGINPHDPRLTEKDKIAVITECMNNFWYFVREVVRLPDINGVKQYELHRGNLALNVCARMNLNIFMEAPRLCKNMSVNVLALYEYIFCTDSKLLLIDTYYTDSILNLERINKLKSLLPDYFNIFNIKEINSECDDIKIYYHMCEEELGIRIANSYRIWINDLPYIESNKSIMEKINSTSSNREGCKLKGLPNGVIITCSGGRLDVEEGRYAYSIKEQSIPFDEMIYDNRQILDRYIDNFVNIKFMYNQLGKDEKWKEDAYLTLNKNDEVFRREVLLDWTE